MTTQEVLDVLAQTGFKAKARGRQIMLYCPFAAVGGHKNGVDRTPSLTINAQSELFFCFGCARGGSLRRFFALVANQLGIDPSLSLMLYNEIDERTPVAERVSHVRDYEDHFREEGPQPVFPSAWLAPFVGSVPKYAVDRGIALETARRWELGWDQEERRLIFPVRDPSHNLVGAVGRIVRGRSHQKYLNYWARLHRDCWQPVRTWGEEYRCQKCGVIPEAQAIAGFRTGQHVYGGHLRTREKKIPVLVEGMIDTVVTAQELGGSPYFPLGLFGVHLSRQQAQLIVDCSHGEAVLFLDDDEAGEAGSQKVRELLGQRLKLRRVDYPHGQIEGKQDPARLAGKKNQILDLIRNANMF
jgi:hypothetical protein